MGQWSAGTCLVFPLACHRERLPVRLDLEKLAASGSQCFAVYNRLCDVCHVRAQLRAHSSSAERDSGGKPGVVSCHRSRLRREAKACSSSWFKPLTRSLRRSARSRNTDERQGRRRPQSTSRPRRFPKRVRGTLKRDHPSRGGASGIAQAPLVRGCTRNGDSIGAPFCDGCHRRA